MRQVYNVVHRKTITNLPLFFVDLEAAEINKDIFALTSLLHTKVKVEEPYKQRHCTMFKLSRLWSYKKYCLYLPRCVRCGENHPSTYYSESKIFSAKCSLCKEDHPSNYKGCQVYKDLESFRKPIFNNNGKQLINNDSNTTYLNNVNNINCKITQPKPPETNPYHCSYTQATSNHNSNLINQSNDTSLTNFQNDFKALINPLLSLLTTVLERLLAQNDK